MHILKLIDNCGRVKTLLCSTRAHLLFTGSAVVSGVTAGIVSGRIVWVKEIQHAWSLKTYNEQLSILLTCCHHYGPSHGAWKTRRQSDDTDGVTQGAQWWSDCYSVVSCTSPNVHTALVSSSTVGYPVPSHSGS